MRNLDKCLKLCRDIRDISEKISELKSMIMSPKIQIISDMPKSRTSNNAIEQYLIKLEHLQKKKTMLEINRNKCWELIRTSLLNKNIDDEEIINMLYFRFYKGYSWNKCAEMLRELYQNSNWNTNKCFRIYRKITDKMHKKHNKFCQ